MTTYLSSSVSYYLPRYFSSDDVLFRADEGTFTENMPLKKAVSIMRTGLVLPDNFLKFWGDYSDVYAREIERSDQTIKDTKSSVEDPSIAPECLDFCKAHGIGNLLQTYLNMTYDVFSGIVSLSAELDYFQDEGEEDEGHIVLRLCIRSDQQTALKENDAWVNWVVDHIEPDDSMFFTMTIEII